MTYARDRTTQALLNTDKSGFEAYKLARDRAIKIKTLEQRLDFLEQAIQQLLEKQNNG